MRSRSTIVAAAVLIGLAAGLSDAVAGQSSAHRHGHRGAGAHAVDAPVGFTDYSRCPVVRRGVQTAQGLRWAYVTTCGN